MRLLHCETIHSHHSRCGDAVTARRLWRDPRHDVGNYAVMLREYSTFLIESNSYFCTRFETSTIIRNFRILTITNFILI